MSRVQAGWACIQPKLPEMAALAYLLLPLTGMVAYFGAAEPRMRFHGIQAVAYGVLWPAAIYVASWITATATQVVFVIGALVWVVLIVGTAVGRDPSLPPVARIIQRWAADSPRDA
jgi:uncharacterized membrane protein